MDGSKVLITGANGQLGRALQAVFPNAAAADASELDITDEAAVREYDWTGIEAILNAAAYTNVDGAETDEGGRAADAVNNRAVGNLAALAAEKNLLLVHISTEYVFDGAKGPHKEDELSSPLSVYGRTKAAGDVQAAKAPKHYIVRTSWVVGNGKNFVRTMLELGKKGVAPKVVNDQVGRPTFADELARGIKFLIDSKAPYGTYNITNEGDPVSWAGLAREIFANAGYNLQVADTTSARYFADKPGSAPRPANSLLDMTKIESIGFKPRDWRESLGEYIKEGTR